MIANLEGILSTALQNKDQTQNAQTLLMGATINNELGSGFWFTVHFKIFIENGHIV